MADLTVPLAVPVVGDREARYLQECVASGFVSSVGPFVARFEREFADRLGVRHAVACASGTAALHIAMRILGVAPGDEVAVSDFTFIASANAIAYEGAEPLLVDSDARTWSLDPVLLEEELRRRAGAGERLPAAIEVAHVLGQPADIEPLLELCTEHGVPLIEDAAEALGASYSGGAVAGRPVGTLGRVGCFSFNGNKIMTTGAGGMLVTDEVALARRARHLTTQAKVPGVGYLHDEVGFNYRLTNVAAALGVAQLEQLDEFVAIKRRIARRYDEALGMLGFCLPPRLQGLDSTYWLYSLLVPEEVGVEGRDRFIDALAVAGIDARALWRPLHLQPPYRGAQTLGGAVGRALFDRGVSLPCSCGLSEDVQDRVIEIVQDAARKTL